MKKDGFNWSVHADRVGNRFFVLHLSVLSIFLLIKTITSEASGQGRVSNKR